MKIYIVCPAYYASGGPELLHQLGYKLNLLGFEAVICYKNCRDTEESPCHPNFEEYKVPYVIETFEDDEENVLVIPDHYTDKMDLEQVQCKKVVWWLAAPSAWRKREAVEAIMRRLMRIPQLIHCAQSLFAKKELLEFGVREEDIVYLSDYINPVHLDASVEQIACREDVVVFNPKKGMENTVQLLQNSSGIIKWQATGDLTPAEVHSAMKYAKVYVDLGAHPGMDRIPREAALGGCCVITNKMGSAAYEDVPIPEQYKHAEMKPDEILQQIYEIMGDFEKHQKEFAGYRRFIFDQYGRFEADAFCFFRRLADRPVGLESKEELMERICRNVGEWALVDALQAIAAYRTFHYEEDLEFQIVEARVRILLQEYAVAEYIIAMALKNYPDNAELHLLKAELLLKMGGKAEQIRREMEYAKELSVFTQDEEAVLEICRQMEDWIVQGKSIS